jgi:hypothetical protein
MLILALLTTVACADIVISEVMANEPSNRVLLEWIEIYNNGQHQEYSNKYRLVVNEDSLDLPVMDCLEPRAYAVLCRRLLPLNGSDCFEYHWGDSSGVWGDYVSERYQAVEISISLSNSSGDILLIDSLNRIVDECHWQSACTDGYSYERNDETDPLSGWHCCNYISGSTPGGNNSPTLESIDSDFKYSDKTLVGGSIHYEYWFPLGTITTISIYDDTGRKRATVIENSDRFQNYGGWHCADSDGDLLPPGLYFIKLNTTGSLSQSKLFPFIIIP